MSFEDVYNALYDQIKAYSGLSYVDQDYFFKGFKEPIIKAHYAIAVDPGNEIEDEEKSAYKNIKIFTYEIDIFMRVMFYQGGVEKQIIGDSDEAGCLALSDDVKAAIRSDLALGYDRQGSSVSSENAGTSFALSASNRYLSVSMNDRTPQGYDTIDCGSSTLSGSAIAANIQTALRTLGNHNDDGYNNALCTFSDSTKKFTVTSQNYGPLSKAVVTAGASNDCSTILGFDNPTELVGRNIEKIEFMPVYAENALYPVRYRVLPVRIFEEVDITA